MRTTVFVCYSHQDSKFKNELLTQLQPFSDAVEVWADNSIPAGVQWLPEIDRALTKADAAVVVVSPDLLASRFVTEHELPRIVERHHQAGMRPMWLHYRPASYKRTPLAKYQCLHDPKTPLSLLRRPIRERELVKIARKIGTPPAERPVGNILRAADDVFTAERGAPSMTVEVRPHRIDLRMAGTTKPFISGADLETQLDASQRRVLRAHERRMDKLLRRWSALYPRVTPTRAADPSDVRELSAIRTALSREFDAALGLIESLGYTLDDHYQAVRHIMSQQVPTSAAKVSAARPEISARFVLDKKGRPQYSKSENGYWLQTWLTGTPDRTASVVWRVHPSISPSQETVETRPEFRKDLVSYGDFTIQADLRTKDRTVLKTLRMPLVEALRRHYQEPRSRAIEAAIDDIARH